MARLPRRRAGPALVICNLDRVDSVRVARAPPAHGRNVFVISRCFASFAPQALGRPPRGGGRGCFVLFAPEAAPPCSGGASSAAQTAKARTGSSPRGFFVLRRCFSAACPRVGTRRAHRQPCGRGAASAAPEVRLALNFFLSVQSYALPRRAGRGCSSRTDTAKP